MQPEKEVEEKMLNLTEEAFTKITVQSHKTSK